MGENDILTNKIEELKVKIYENVSVNDDVVCALCDELILEAKKCKDWQSIAFGYIWRADYYFYVASSMKDVSRELDFAQLFIDRQHSCELLEKFYTLKHLLYENTFDIQSAFQYTLKALDVAEKSDNRSRVGANYGNLATFYLECRNYKKAQLYTEKAVGILRVLPKTNPRILRIMFSNLVHIYIKLDKLELARQTVEELSTLPVAEKDLKLYVHYGYLLYYSKRKNSVKSVYYLQEMFYDGLMDCPNRAYIIEFLMNALEAMILIGDTVWKKKLFSLLKTMLKSHEREPMLELIRLNIKCAQQLGKRADLCSYYREYYHLYLDMEEQTGRMKADGLRSMIELNNIKSLYSESKKELNKLYELANYDGLTEVYNRRYMNIRRDEIINSKLYDRLGYAIIDIDYFKEYNDFYGHVEGDRILKLVARCLQTDESEQMSVFRYGGDEFVCMSWGDGCDRLEAYINQITARLLEKSYEHLRSHCEKRITLSIGYGSGIVKTVLDAVSLFDQADAALYLAKSSGRNNVKSIWDKDSLKGERNE